MAKSGDSKCTAPNGGSAEPGRAALRGNGGGAKCAEPHAEAEKSSRARPQAMSHSPHGWMDSLLDASTKHLKRCLSFSSRQMKCGPFWDGVAAKGGLSTGISNRVRVPSPHVSQGKGPRNPPKKHTLKLPKDSYVSLFAYPLEFLKQLVPPWTYVSHATGCNPKEPSATYGGV